MRDDSVKDQQRFIQLAGNIYDAALDSALWPDVLAKAARFVGAQACLLVTKTATGRPGNACQQFGIDARFAQLYSEFYCDLDPITTMLGPELERIASIADLVPLDDFRKSDFYRDWLQPQGLIDAAGVKLDKNPTSCAYLTFLRAEACGGVDEDMRQRMQILIPHMRRAIVVEKAIELRQAEAATFADILDNLSAGMFLVDADGDIVHANAAGNVLQRSGELLRSVHGRLTANDPHTDQNLREIFAAAGNAAIDAKGVSLPLAAKNGDHYIGKVLPLTAIEGHHIGMNTVVAALFVRKAELDALSPAGVIGKAYNLTPTELRVLLAIVDVGGVPEVAQNLGVADTTIKTHLSRLFEKTGAGRQADLVKLVAGFSNPLIG
jgi:DNA-binding CsgD family transcriptional regulator/PAS domain-containing protein